MYTRKTISVQQKSSLPSGRKALVHATSKQEEKKTHNNCEARVEEHIRERIRMYFESGDKEMMELGRRLCHAYRIPYYVVCSLSSAPGWIGARRAPDVPVYKLTHLSLNGVIFQPMPVYVSITGKNIDRYKCYKIELCRKN